MATTIDRGAGLRRLKFVSVAVLLAGCGGGTVSGGSETPDAANATPPTCGDGIHNGNETDIDCGGGMCAHCGVGHMCRSGDDCGTLVCTREVCVDASCTDGVMNGSETDVDCGGACGRCADSKGCRGASDCQSGICKAGSCALITCMDGMKNGGETDIDCGGAHCPPCALGQGCVLHADCAGLLCDGAHAQCAPAASCQALHAARPELSNGTFTVSADGTGVSLTVVCDMRFDGGGWTMVFHHDLSGGFFTGGAEALASSVGDPTAKRYSILSSMKRFLGGRPALFRMDWPGYPKRNVWQQSTDPTSDVNVGGYLPLDLQSTSDLFGGLELGNGGHGPQNGGASFIDGSVNNSWWYYAIGQFVPWGMPAGLVAADDVAGANHGVSEVRLWIK